MIEYIQRDLTLINQVSNFQFLTYFITALIFGNVGNLSISCIFHLDLYFLIGFASLLSFSRARHTSPQSETQTQSRLFLDAIICQGPDALELLASKVEPLLAWRDTLLVLEHRLRI